MGVVKRNEVSVEELGLMMGGAHRHSTIKFDRNRRIC